MFLAGRISKDPELKLLPNNKKLVQFNVGTKQFGARTWITCEAWGEGAEKISNWFRKGDTIFLEGKFQTQNWKNGGFPKEKLVLIVEKFQNPQKSEE